MASAFGNHASGSDPNDSKHQGIEVQEVTVYVREGEHGNRVFDVQSAPDGAESEPKLPQNIGPSRQQGSISIKTIPVLSSHFNTLPLPSNPLSDKPKSKKTVTDADDHEIPGGQPTDSSSFNTHHLTVRI